MSCSHETCDKKYYAKGLCKNHYSTKLMNKNAKNPVTIEHITDELIKRFYAKVDKTEDCWNWTGAKTASRKERPLAPATQGYGVISVNNRPFYAHRLSMLMKQGYLTEGLVIDHLCNNSTCVNPDHIEEVTNRENVVRSPRHSMNTGGYSHYKEFCKRGHKRGIEMKGKPCVECYPVKKAK